jgi:prepilin-type N-terminal cleavage/methylation domain-containing protein
MQRQGFTLVEVMVSLGVMTISARALFSMQGQATRANTRARDMTTASQIAQNVIERLKMDGLVWNSISAGDTSNTEMLKNIDGWTPGDFKTMPERTEPRAGLSAPLSNAFNQSGEDVLTSGAAVDVLATIRYCASWRLTWVYESHRAMRADVRVWWTKEAPSRSILTDFPACADDNIKLNPGGSLYDSYHVVYLSTVLRPHPL